MSVNLSIKNVPDSVAERLRARAERNHRSLQGELMSIVEAAAMGPNVAVADAARAEYRSLAAAPAADALLNTLDADLGAHSLSGGPWLSREAAHDRTAQSTTGPKQAPARRRLAPAPAKRSARS